MFCCRKITTFQSISSAADLQSKNLRFNYSDESHFQSTTDSSITMRSNSVKSRSNSIRSSSASSSSGCPSEQSSTLSTPSSGSGPVLGSQCLQDDSNYHYINHLPTSSSPHHFPVHQPGSMNAFEVDFPVGTIKRKPNVLIQPKIPLTNTTRNLALQSDDALLEVNDDNCDNNVSFEEGSYGSASAINDDPFQRGTFKSGTLRRSSTEERGKNKFPMHSLHHQPIYRTNLIKSNHIDNSDDESLPPPPPPASTNLKETESTLSLNAAFPPPPPPEVLNPPPSPSPNLSEQNEQKFSELRPPSMTMLPLPPMTPQPQPKSRLTRRLSDLSENSAYFNFRNNYDPICPVGDVQNGPPLPFIYSPNSRASIASSADSSCYVTMKSNYQNNRNRMHRHNSVDYYQQKMPSWNKFGTSPRLRPFEPMANTETVEQFYTRQQSKPSNYEKFVPQMTTKFFDNPSSPPTNINVTSQPQPHCQIVSSDHNLVISTNNVQTSRVQIYAQCQQEKQHLLPSSKHSQAEENHYMSISPHLLQKHQQMLRQKEDELRNSNGVYGVADPMIATPYHVPEDLFLQNMKRVMQKKWHVAQMLQQDTNISPGQVLGFRDSAYLPPPPPPPPPTTSTQIDLIDSSYIHPSPVPSIESKSPYHHGQSFQTTDSPIKSVQFATVIPRNTPPQTPTHQSIYGTGGLKKIPPPPPRRSESTQLTSTIAVNPINISNNNNNNGFASRH